jgi:hypothetical protein
MPIIRFSRERTGSLDNTPDLSSREDELTNMISFGRID